MDTADQATAAVAAVAVAVAAVACLRRHRHPHHLMASAPTQLAMEAVEAAVEVAISHLLQVKGKATRLV